MNLALSLLIAAMSLLTQIHNSPNISPAFEAQAESIANQAITYAQSVINEQTTQTPINSQTTIETPVTFGSVTSTCVENPVLTLTATSSQNGESNITGDYSTGCPIDPNLKWSYTNPSETNSGTVAGGSNAWYVNTQTIGNNFQLTVYHQNLNNPFSMTIGTTTKNF